MSRSALVLDGASGPALAVVRSLGRAGWRVLTTAGTRSAASRHAAGVYEIAAADEDPAAFVAGVLTAVETEPFDVVVPATDASVELLWANEGVLGDARILGADRPSFEIAVDKARTLAAADRAGFGTPEWLAPSTVEEARASIERIGLPCVVKPRRSYSRDGTRLSHRRHTVVRKLEELEAALHAQTGDDGALPVVEAFVPGRALSVTAVLREGRILALVARETLTFAPIGGGTSVWKRTIPPTDTGVRDAADLLVSLGYEGLAEVEFQVPADKRPRLMEIGMRVHGWIPLAVAAGVDMPLIAAQSLLGDSLPDAAPYRVGVEMRWPAGEVNRLREAFRPGSVLPPGVTRRSVLASLWPPWRPGMSYDGFHINDPLPWLPSPVRRRAERPPARPAGR